MKTLKLTTLAITAAVLFSSNGASAAILCSIKPDTTTKAEDCAREFLAEKGDMWSFVSGKSHTGKISDCAGKVGGNSYFTNDEGEFKDGLDRARVDQCKAHSSDPDAYVCYIHTGPEACYIASGSSAGQLSTTAIMSMGTSSRKLITFFPIK